MTESRSPSTHVSGASKRPISARTQNTEHRAQCCTCSSFMCLYLLHLATLLFHGFCTVVTSFGLSTAIIVILRSRHCTSYFCRSDQWLNIVSNPGYRLDVNFRVHPIDVYAALLEFYIIQMVILRSLNELSFHAFH